MATPSRSNPLTLAVLTLLWERDMHPYEMSRTLKERNKDESVRLNYGSLYSIIDSLTRSELIEPSGVEQDGNRPPRTVYRITDDGVAELRSWMRDLVGTPVKEYPQFEAALSFLPVLGPDEVIPLLDQRVHALTARIDQTTASLASTPPALPRLFSIEAEYDLALLRADRDYSAALLAELRDGSLGGVDMWRLMHQATDSTGRIDYSRVDPKFAEMLAELDQLSSPTEAKQLAEPPTD